MKKQARAKNDISQDLFSSLFDVKDELELYQNCENFEHQCHLINNILKEFDFFLHTYEKRKKRNLFCDV